VSNLDNVLSHGISSAGLKRLNAGSNADLGLLRTLAVKAKSILCSARKSRPKGRGLYPRTATDQAVINFVNRWRTGKKRFEQLTARQQALRESLRQLAQADARILRELDGALPAMSQPEPQVAGELAEGLEKLGVKELKALCKERGFKGYTGLNKAALIQARLDRMETLLLQIAERVGVSDSGLD
jgi:uncharacterized protein with von Willebrand factor type A (vWA) domain